MIAIRWLFEKVSSQSANVFIQKPEQTALMKTRNNDDEILACLIYVRSFRTDRVLLMSDDQNLNLKAATQSFKVISEFSRPNQFIIKELNDCFDLSPPVQDCHLKTVADGSPSVQDLRIKTISDRSSHSSHMEDCEMDCVSEEKYTEREYQGDVEMEDSCDPFMESIYEIESVYLDYLAVHIKDRLKEIQLPTEPWSLVEIIKILKKERSSLTDNITEFLPGYLEKLVQIGKGLQRSINEHSSRMTAGDLLLFIKITTHLLLICTKEDLESASELLSCAATRLGRYHTL